MHPTEAKVNGAGAELDKRLRLSVAARNFAGARTAQSLETIAGIGFDTVDNFNWRDPAEFNIYREMLPRLGLQAGVLVINKKPDVDALACSLVSPPERQGFLHELRLCIEAAKQVNCRRLEVLTGNRIPGVSRRELMANCVAALRAAVPTLEESGMVAVVELLNTVDHPGYFLNYLKDGVEMIDRVGSLHVKLLVDIYHLQIMEGNLIEHIRQTIDYIGQLHFADVPGRHEPGTGEINYLNVFRAIFELGDRYRGYVTAEYEPTDNSFRDLVKVKQLATFS